ncbi:MAG: hypothetical protein R3F19_07215 [Verrucomicrobiales bacterium]
MSLTNAAVESDAEATIQWAESLSESQHSLLSQTLETALLGEGHGAPSRIRLDDSETLREEGAESAADIPYFLQRPD